MADTLKNIKCPACQHVMTKVFVPHLGNFASIKQEIQVDECYSCGGKFLDFGELEKIRAQYKTESDRSQDTMKYLYSTVGLEIKKLEQEVEEGRRNRSTLKKLFDSIIYS